MEAKTIAAIEIGSSKIKGAVATRDADGHLKVIAVSELASDTAVRHGRVQNVREVSGAVNEIIRRLEENPAIAPRRIQAVTLSLGGRSMVGNASTATLQFPDKVEINEQAIRRLRSEAEKDFAGAKNVEAIIARKYFVDNVNVAVNKIVGNVGTSLRGDFLLITCARDNRQNLERLKFETIPKANVDYKLRPLAMANMVLTDDDRQLGCALIDFGSETTTISIYKNGSLAFVATLPMGSHLITSDLMSGLTLTESAAEELKITKGNVSEGSTKPGAEDANNYIRARAGEIEANIVNQINLSAIGTSNLGAGIVLVGRGAKLPGFDAMLAAQTRLNVRLGALPPTVTFADPSMATFDNIDIAALLLAAEPKKGALSEPAGSPAKDPEPAAAHKEEPDTPHSFIQPEEPTIATEEEAVLTIDEPDEIREDDDDDILKDDPEADKEPERPKKVEPAKAAPAKPEQKKSKKETEAAVQKPEKHREAREGDSPTEKKPSKPSALQKMVTSIKSGLAELFMPVDPTEDDDDDDEYDYFEPSSPKDTHGKKKNL